jgi:hypothetical protein
MDARKCSDCNGTGEYHGLNVVEKCRSCAGDGLAVKRGLSPLRAAAAAIGDRVVIDAAWEQFYCGGALRQFEMAQRENDYCDALTYSAAISRASIVRRELSRDARLVYCVKKIEAAADLLVQGRCGRSDFVHFQEVVAAVLLEFKGRH